MQQMIQDHQKAIADLEAQFAAEKAQMESNF